MIFCALRFLLGAVQSAFIPTSYSLIADYFPPEYRSRANAVSISGSYLGSALASLTVLLISKWGWRAMYKIVGIAGIILGILFMILVKEPKKGVFDQNF